jgi:hypothetical protein
MDADMTGSQIMNLKSLNPNILPPNAAETYWCSQVSELEIICE